MLSEMEILSIFEEYRRDLNNPSLYIGKAIPEKKEYNALNAYCDNRARRAVALFDGTVFGSAKEGMVFTDTTLYYHYVFEKWAVDYAEVERIELGRGSSEYRDPKSDYLYLVTRHAEYKIEISNLDKVVLRRILEEICGLGRGDRRRDPYDRRYDDRRRGDRFDDRYDDRRHDRFDDRYDDRYDERYDERHRDRLYAGYDDRYDDRRRRR